MKKKGFFGKLFGSKPKGKKDKNTIKDNSTPKIKKKLENKPVKVKTPVKIQKPITKEDKKLQKKIQKVEMRLAKKIATNHLIMHIHAEKDMKKSNSESDQKKGEMGQNSKPKKTFDEMYTKTGITGFDALLQGKGIPTGTSVLIEGGPGSGKTIFCLQTAYNACVQGKKVLYMSFEEPEEKLIEHMEKFGWNARKYVKSGHLNIRRFNALDIARSVEALLSEAKKELLIEVQPILIPQDIQPDLVFVDSLTSIASAFSGEESRFRIYMERLFRYLESHNMSSLLIREVPNPTHVGQSATGREEATSFLSDGIIVFYNVIYATGKRTRAVEILKLRGMPFDRKIVEAEIVNKKGLVINANKSISGNYKLT